MQKSKTRLTGERREKFRDNLDELCDIGASDAKKQIQKNRLLSSADKADNIAFHMDWDSAREGLIRGSGMVFVEKKRRQEERKETEMKMVHGTSRSSISSSEASSTWNAVFLLWIIRTRRWRRMQTKRGLNRTKRSRHLIM